MTDALLERIAIALERIADRMTGDGESAQAADTLRTVPEVAEQLRVSPKTLYEAIGNDEFPHVRIGRRILVPSGQLNRWLAGRQS